MLSMSLIRKDGIDMTEPALPPPPHPDGKDDRRRRATAQFIGFLLVLAAANVTYRVVYAAGMQRSAALFVGVPTLLAIGLVLLPRSRSATGMALKGSALALCLAAVILPEGIVCLVFAFPLVAVVAIIIGGAVDLSRRWADRSGPTLMVVALPLVVLSMEGVGGSPIDARDRAAATVVVAAPVDGVADALVAPPRFARELPAFLTFGFNRPVRAEGSGLDVGARRTIEFTGGTHDDHPVRLFAGTGDGSVDHRSTMTLTVVESRPGRVVFAVDHDGTMLARWVDLDRAVVTWQPAGAGLTAVTWSLEYERLLFPSFYFSPLERYGMDRASEYLLGAVVLEQIP
jgi:hypothetical protein